MSPVPVIVAIALAALLLAGCGEDTTIINQTTTTVSSPAAGDTTVVVETAPAAEEPEEEVATTPAAPESAKPDPAPTPRPTLSPNSENYSGPCGEQGVVIGGKPGASATSAVPGYANLTAVSIPCGDAVAAATGWLAAWEAACAAGCSKRIEGMRCDYSGSGSLVECANGDGSVRFALVFDFS